MEATDIVAEVLNVYVVRREEEVDPAFRVDRKRASGGRDGGFYHRLDREAGEGLSVGVEPIVLLFAPENMSGYVVSGLVRVKLYGLPPAGDGGCLGVDGGDGADEVTDNPFLGALPGAVPYGVDRDIGGEDRSHVVFQVNKFRRAFVFF